MHYGAAMSALHDRVMNSSIDDLVAAADRGEIDPDELWQEVLDSLDRSVDALRLINDDALPSNAHDDWLLKVGQRQDRIDAMINDWLAGTKRAGLDIHWLPEESRRAVESA